MCSPEHGRHCKDILDPALIRPGRFDRIIYVPAPDVAGREEFLQIPSSATLLFGGIPTAALSMQSTEVQHL